MLPGLAAWVFSVGLGERFDVGRGLPTRRQTTWPRSTLRHQPPSPREDTTAYIRSFTLDAKQIPRHGISRRVTL
jgi:hypothetical protein